MEDIPGNVFRRQLTRPLPTVAQASGNWIMDAEGRRWLDAAGGPLVVNVGHGRPEIAEAVRAQILAADYVHPTMFTGDPVERLATRLASRAPEGIRRFYFMCSGSEAVETAIKLARQIHLEHGRSGRHQLVARWKSYHGLTLGALSATGKPSMRAPFAPLLTETIHIPPPYCLRCAFGLSFPDCRLRCAAALEEAIYAAGPDNVSAFLGETVSGATLAAVVPPPGYWAAIREICDRHGVLLILDEVLCGLGRTGHWFASEAFDVIPDMVTLGKGLAGGVIALSAVGVRESHYAAIAHGSGAFIHGGTFSHHQVAAAAGNAVLDILENEGLVTRVALTGRELGDRLRKALASHPHVGDIRGMGFLWGVEMVRDRTTLEPFPRRLRVAETAWREAFDAGVLFYTASGFASRGDGDALLVGPPFGVSDKEMDTAVSTLARAIDRATERALAECH